VQKKENERGRRERVRLTSFTSVDTPWDEPTKRSPEFIAYFQGQSYDPWPRITGDALSLLHAMMCINPAKRISIQDIKKHKWFTRKNPLLIDGHGPDATSLAERLLQGLIVSGDLDFDLHSDGKRAKVPESISLTQPETFGPGLDLDLNRLPPSSALAAFRTSDARKIALSQQVSARRSNFPSASLDGRGVAAGAAGSQFTQALNHMVSSL
jgi:serine/threonine-protein kinase Chk1